MMAKDDIYHGLKSAIERGWTLKQGMMSFYNAGYPKEEIESAARRVMAERKRGPVNPNGQISTNPKSSQTKPLQQKNVQAKSEIPAQKASSPRMSQNPAQPMKRPMQAKPMNPKPIQSQPQVSSYGEKPKFKFPWTTFILFVILLVLIGALASMFIFKPEILEFLNNNFA